MTFLWIDNQGLPRHRYGQRRFERRIDDHTAGDIADALRARGVQAAALAMEHLQVDMDVALRVLAGVSVRRSALQEAARAACASARGGGAQRAPVVGLAPELAGA